ncbi:hypothetical protein ACYF6T_10835 [Streptomyces sp. 7R007]
MPHVYLSALRRTAPLGALAGALVGLVFAASMTAEGDALSAAAVTFLEVGAVFTVVFTAVVAAGSTGMAVRTARWEGARPERGILATEHTAERHLRGIAERHPNHVLGSLLGRLGPEAELKRRDVGRDGSATADVVCRSTSGLRVTAAIRVAASGDGFTVVGRTAPAQTWRKLDGGASWEVLRHVMRAAAEERV